MQFNGHNGIQSSKVQKSESRLISLHLTDIFLVGMKMLVVSLPSNLQPTWTYTNLQFLLSIGPRLMDDDDETMITHQNSVTDPFPVR
jgi:hypothetical protein